MKNKLFEAFKLNDITLPNRLVMAPMTRNRANEQAEPTDRTAEYYTQRASAGLIITEATQVSAQANGYINTPGSYTENQAKAWKKVTDSVHQAGGRIFLQLWHTGRVSHTSLQPGQGLPLGPSAINASSMVFTENGFEPTVTPRELVIEEIPVIVDQFEQAAIYAKSAGFDGVEIHGANGYLVDQFLRDGSNHRTDEYGGRIENRMRFPLEVVQAVTKVWGPGKVGLRISPRISFNGMSDSDPNALFSAMAKKLNDFDLAFLHIIEPLPGAPNLEVNNDLEPLAPMLRKKYKGVIMLNGGYGKETAEKALKSDEADLISFGAMFLANPDLPERFRQNAKLNTPDQATFYGGNEKGYTDYPFLS